ncbi:putative maltokinase [Lewinella sp. W8]|uniref:putative maltokinase n=1 Tax=Lewinella sp. W8 TaxID=2528208 RepID=UPI00106838B5|nr:putative maltokinase [Lewinella sp. W8]MTB50218.1 phosphotransferase [Lewinella sp. W8]
MTTPTPLQDLLSDPIFLPEFHQQLLPKFLTTQRWFTSKGKSIAACSLDHFFAITSRTGILLVSVKFTDGSLERYQMPMAWIKDGGAVEDYLASHPKLVVTELAAGGILADAVPLPEFRKGIFDSIRQNIRREDGFNCEAGRALEEASVSSESIVPAIDTSNTAIIYGDQFFFKLFRKLDPGLNPDLELVRFLSEHGGFDNCPPYGGSVGVGDMADEHYLNLGMLSGKVDNLGDAWEFFQGLTARYYASDGPVDAETLQRAALLGTRTAEMHLALNRGATAGALLTPTAMTREYRREICAAAAKILSRQMKELSGKLADLAPAQRELASRVVALEDQLQERLNRLQDAEVNCDLIRIHGDYHLGQVLVTEDDFYIIDFEGEPLLSIPERRRRRPALKDVAGMLRSFHYAAQGQLLLNPDRYDAARRAALADRAATWNDRVSEAYLTAYYERCGDAAFLPAADGDRQLLLDLFTLEKAVYEVAYELNSRPDWLAIPLGGVLEVAGE